MKVYINAAMWKGMKRTLSSIPPKSKWNHSGSINSHWDYKAGICRGY